MAFEAGFDLAWVLIIGLAVLVVMLAFYVLLQPSVEGGFFTNLANALTQLFGLR